METIAMWPSKRNIDTLGDKTSYQSRPGTARKTLGFSLLELMMVLTMILLAATITQPIYQNIILHGREATLRDTLFTMRSMIDRFTLDFKRPPESLDEMVEKGYFGDVPIDPITRSPESPTGWSSCSKSLFSEHFLSLS